MMTNVQQRLNRAIWPVFALSGITNPADVRRVRKWLHDNCVDEYYIRTIKETRGTRKTTIATLVRVKEDNDALLFKLTWADYE